MKILLAYLAGSLVTLCSSLVMFKAASDSDRKDRIAADQECLKRKSEAEQVKE